MPMKIIAYYCVCKTSPAELNEALAKAIKDGWQPFGSISISSYVNAEGESWTDYAQAIVKYAKEGQ